MALSKIRTVAGKIFGKYLLLTNTVSCGGLLAIGDAITQKIEHVGHDPATFKYDWPRTGRMFTVGLLMGPFNHAWYTFLDKMLVGNSGRIVFKKICCDQCVAAPYFCTTFLMGMALLEGKGWSVSFGEWKEKFLIIYAMDWFIWPPSQFINFYFLPTKYRVLYVSFITLIWDTLLSYIKHKEQAEEKYKLLEESKSNSEESLGSSLENPSEEKAPLAEISAPIVEVTAPAAEVTAPAPVAEVTAPVAEVMAPVAEVTAPVAEVTAPAAEVTAPATEIAAPDAEIKDLAAEIMAPVAEIMDPAVEIKASDAEIKTEAAAPA